MLTDLYFSVRPEQYYTEVIARPMSVLGRRTGPGPGREVEVVAEEEQQFLSRQQQYLAQGIPPSQGGAMPPGVQKTPDRKVVGSPGVQGSPKKVSRYISISKSPTKNRKRHYFRLSKVLLNAPILRI